MTTSKASEFLNKERSKVIEDYFDMVGSSGHKTLNWLFIIFFNSEEFQEYTKEHQQEIVSNTLALSDFLMDLRDTLR